MDHQTLRVSQSQEDINIADQKDYLQQFYYTMPGQPLPNPAHLGLDTIQDLLCELGMKPLLYSNVGFHNNLVRQLSATLIPRLELQLIIMMTWICLHF